MILSFGLHVRGQHHPLLGFKSALSLLREPVLAAWNRQHPGGAWRVVGAQYVPELKERMSE